MWLRNCCYVSLKCHCFLGVFFCVVLIGHNVQLCSLKWDFRHTVGDATLIYSKWLFSIKSLSKMCKPVLLDLLLFCSWPTFSFSVDLGYVAYAYVLTNNSVLKSLNKPDYSSKKQSCCNKFSAYWCCGTCCVFESTLLTSLWGRIQSTGTFSPGASIRCLVFIPHLFSLSLSNE